MEKIFDERKITDIEVTEASINYNKDIDDMDKEEIEKEIRLIEKEIQKIKTTIQNSGPIPSYILRERLKNAIIYKEKLEKKFTQLNVDTEKRLEEMKKDLERKYETGTITKEYRDKYINQLDESILRYREQEERKKEEREKKKQENKSSNKHIFKKFKNKLIDYKK